MNENTENILEENAREYYKNAISAERKGEFNTAVVLFFKTLTSLADLLIFRDMGRIPSSHSERFRILEEKYADIYEILDDNFSFYQDSYRIKLNKEICEVVKDGVKKLLEKTKVEV